MPIGHEMPRTASLAASTRSIGRISRTLATSAGTRRPWLAKPWDGQAVGFLTTMYTTLLPLWKTW